MSTVGDQVQWENTAERRVEPKAQILLSIQMHSYTCKSINE
jgi:hypothetical protein